jgi:ribosome-associated toxin RatA of RatAB toxin-antitoxin module
MAAALAALCLCAAARAEGVHVTVTDHADTYEVRGRFETSARLDTIWAVLTDYARIPRFVESIRHSEVLARDSARVRLRQVAVIGLFLMRQTARVTLEVHEQPPFRIEFRDIQLEDFHAYRGSWSLSRDSTHTVVLYALDASPRSGAPGWLGRSLMSHSARGLLQQVRAEVERRASTR